MIVAIDGPAASGKSTVARALAARLGLPFLDTGSMYRAVTLKVLERGLDPTDGEACAAVAEAIALDYDGDGRIRIDGQPGEPHIRGAEVNRHVSRVSAHPGVRRAIVPKQRALAEQRGAVAEGRDTTTVVFPEADHKFFLTASPRERARRRAAEEDRVHEVEAIQAAIERRDARDRERPDSPLRRSPDALQVDTDDLTPEQVVERLLEHLGAGA